MSNPQIHRTKTGFVGIKEGEEPVTISDKKSVDELGALLEKRRSIGLQITKKLIEHGLNADETEECAVGGHGGGPGGGPPGPVSGLANE